MIYTDPGLYHDHVPHVVLRLILPARGRILHHRGGGELVAKIARGAVGVEALVTVAMAVAALDVEALAAVQAVVEVDTVCEEDEKKGQKKKKKRNRGKQYSVLFNVYFYRLILCFFLLEVEQFCSRDSLAMLSRLLQES